MKEISIDTALQKGFPLIDVRSPSEFRVDTIPGAVNIPILNDKEREQVGICYRNQGSRQAKALGFKLVAEKLPRIIEDIRAYDTPVIFCWRGGFRSKSVCALLDMLEANAFRLTGGYKSYRKKVNDFFDALGNTIPVEFIVIHGLTGVGKTEVLHELARMGETVVDLERYANNRGSVFGAVGLGSQPSQKKFESSIFSTLYGNTDRPVFVECESRRIGRIVIPENMFRWMQEGRNVLIYDTIDRRIRRIIQEYLQPTTDLEELLRPIENLKARLGNEKVQELKELLEKQRFDTVVEYLLLSYYDPLYGYPSGPSSEYDLCLANADSKNTAAVISEFFNGPPGEVDKIGGVRK